MDDVAYQENMFWPIILGHICSEKSSNWAISCFYRVKEHTNLSFYWMEEHIDNALYQESILYPIILCHTYYFKTLKLSDFMYLPH